MRQLILSVLALGACTVTQVCVSVDASSASTIQTPTVYGQAVWGNFVGNHTIGGPYRNKVALRGRTTFSGCFDRFETYFIAAPNNRGYSKGDGGDIRISVQTLDANDLPSGSKLGGPVIYSPNLDRSTGYLRSGQTIYGTLFPVLRFAVPACLSAGQTFAVVLENIDPDPANNYAGVNTLGVGRPQNSRAVDPIWAVLMQPSRMNWTQRAWPDESHVPIIRICTSAGACILQTYMETAGPKLIGGAAAARQLMTPTANLVVRSCKLTLGRASNAATRVRVEFTTLSGDYLNSGSAYADVEISGLPVAGSGYLASEVTAAFRTPVSLTAGLHYALVITSPTTNGVWIAPVKDGANYFDTTSSFGGEQAWVQYIRGAAWTDWFGKGADLQFYCAL